MTGGIRTFIALKRYGSNHSGAIDWASSNALAPLSVSLLTDDTTHYLKDFAKPRNLIRAVIQLCESVGSVNLSRKVDAFRPHVDDKCGPPWVIETCSSATHYFAQHVGAFNFNLAGAGGCGNQSARAGCIDYQVLANGRPCP
jgi:hypothetical protein